MQKQTFSGKNLRKIFDAENRKGKYLAGSYFPAVAALSSDIRQLNKEINETRLNKQTLSSEAYKITLENLNLKKQLLTKKRDNTLSDELDTASKNILKKDFKITLTQVQVSDGKHLYTYNNSIETFLALKKIQQNLSDTYHVKQSNRQLVVKQLQSVLSDSFPKHVFKLDISNFYESIPRLNIQNKLNRDALLTNTTNKIISNLLNQYGLLSSSNIGIPRGVGISAYLAELYMRDFDSKMKTDQDLIYYARYVDDIIAIYAKNSSFNRDRKKSQIEKSLKALTLQLNNSKTKSFDGSNAFKFEYLGYKLQKHQNTLSLSMSDTKLQRYKARIDKSFYEYQRNKVRNKKKASSLLINRIKFLTGNTKLANNKRNVYVGIYFSNSLMNNNTSLLDLDSHLASKITTISEPKLNSKLQQHSHVQGFSGQVFHRFDSTQISSIVKAWRA